MSVSSRVECLDGEEEKNRQLTVRDVPHGSVNAAACAGVGRQVQTWPGPICIGTVLCRIRGLHPSASVSSSCISAKARLTHPGTQCPLPDSLSEEAFQSRPRPGKAYRAQWAWRGRFRLSTTESYHANCEQTAGVMLGRKPTWPESRSARQQRLYLAPSPVNCLHGTQEVWSVLPSGLDLEREATLSSVVSWHDSSTERVDGEGCRHEGNICPHITAGD
jgi:hypothetical protein